MGQNSVVDQVSNPVGAIFGQDSGAGRANQYANLLGLGVSGYNAAADRLKPPDAPGLQSPNSLSSTPSIQQANTTALQNQLAKEKMAASTSSMLNGGQGLLDEPTTTSRVLMGT